MEDIRDRTAIGSYYASHPDSAAYKLRSDNLVVPVLLVKKRGHGFPQFKLYSVKTLRDREESRGLRVHESFAAS